MRAYVWLILFGVVLIAPFLLRLAISPNGESSDVAGQDRLVVITPHNQDIRREFARAFDQWHRRRFGQGVSIDYRTPGGAVDIKRLLENTYEGYQTGETFADTLVAPADVVWGGGDFFFDQELKKLIETPEKKYLSVLQPMTLNAKLLAEAFPQTEIAGVRLYDHNVNNSPPQWVGVCLSSFGIVFNPDVYHALDLPAPTSWNDLADPRLAGLVALADPTRSGSAAVAYMVVIQRAMADAEEEYLKLYAKIDADDLQYQQAIARGWKRGMGRLLLIAANARYFTDSASQVPNDVAHGEAAAGMAIDFYGRVVQESVGDQRLQFVSPVAATAITPDPVAILRGASGERLVLANRFVEFLLTREAQLLWICKPGTPAGPRQRALRRPPIRRDVYADRAGWADDVNPFAEAGGFNQRGAWMALFPDTRAIWAAAWIDSREALKDAYATILQVTDSARRARLIEELSDLPIEMKDVAQYRAERERIEKEQGDVEQFKARRRIEWSKHFRAHYEAVADKAR